MKILQVTYRLAWPPKDGGAIGIYNFTKGYYEAGADLTLFALNTKKHHINLADLPYERFKKYADVRAVDIDTDIKAWDAFANLFTTKSYNIERFYSKEARKHFEALLKEKHFDIIHFDGPFTGNYLHVARKYSKARCVMRAHNVEFKIWERLAESTPTGFKKSYLKLLANRLKKYELNLINHFDAILPISNYDASIFKSSGCTKPMYIIPAGVFLEDFHPETSKIDLNAVFHLGSLDWMPNQEAVLWFVKEIWPKVQEKCPNASFYVAGRNMPKWLPVKDISNIEWTGEVDDAFKFMNGKAIMVVPLKSGSGIRIKILEGMAMNKCIVTTRIGAEGIDVTNGDNILIADEPNTFSEKVVELLNDKSRILAIGHNARKLVEENYDNRKLVSNLLNYYSDIIR